MISIIWIDDNRLRRDSMIATVGNLQRQFAITPSSSSSYPSLYNGSRLDILVFYCNRLSLAHITWLIGLRNSDELFPILILADSFKISHRTLENLALENGIGVMLTEEVSAAMVAAAISVLVLSDNSIFLAALKTPTNLFY